MGNIVDKIFRVDRRILNKYKKQAKKVESYADKMASLSDDELKHKTVEFKERLSKGETLDDIKFEAFAVCREAARRVLGMYPFEVQIIGGLVLHDGEIAEMKTGEGKTLTETMPTYLNALEGKGVHIVTVNEYQIYRWLGLTTGVNLHALTNPEKKAAHACDVTYTINSELGFDYLRDNMAPTVEQRVLRGLNYVIVDEADSVLIDESRTPLIISGGAKASASQYQVADRFVKMLKASTQVDEDYKRKHPDYVPDGDYEIDVKTKTVNLTDKGVDKAERMFGLKNLYAPQYQELVHRIHQALKANYIMIRDVQYLVDENHEIQLIDQFTGRVLKGREYSDGLQQAIQAKENVEIKEETTTLATITYQNFFRLFKKLSGMTGTAKTEEEEFNKIYNMKVVCIPTNKPVRRLDEDDCVFKNVKGKFKAIANQVEECYKKKQPVLIGTVSIEKSELLSNLLEKKHIPHQVLNAKYHERESKIIAQAGVPGAVTIATNMAGRGTDIMLGGNADFLIKDMYQQVEDPELRKIEEEKIRKKVEEDKKIATEAGGLYILGTERHESRRIDNQLRGRSGRQGDPGQSKFFLSLEDDLLRIFGTDKLGGMLGKLGLEEEEAIVHPWISKSVERAQKKVENVHYEMRKNVLRYDDVVNEQRLIIFEQRMDIIKANDVSEEISYLREEKNREILERYISEKSHIDNWDLKGLQAEIERIYGECFDIQEYVDNNNVLAKDVLDKINQYTTELYKKKEELYTAPVMRQIEKRIFLLTIDKYWKDHLYNLDKLRQGINFRAYAQKDPLLEYKREAFELFERLLYNMNEELLIRIFHIVINIETINTNEQFLKEKQDANQNKLQYNRTELLNTMNKKTQENNVVKQETMHNKVNPIDRDPNDKSTWGKVKRNDPCPCGSGKKYKHCCGKFE